MLEITPSHGSGHRMPVDFTTYLLSSSPPASSLELLSYAFNPDDDFHNRGFDRKSDFTFHQTRNLSSLIERRKAPLKPIIIKPPESGSESSAPTSGSSTPTSPTSTGSNPHSPVRLKKKVSFADHKGKALATVRLLTEPSDMPPRLKPEVLASVTKGASAGVTEQPPLKLCFSQPASDYLAFRDKIEKECVSLENVILKDYRVGGTIKVKNISFHKKVFVRVSFDTWESFEDFPAHFVQGVSDHNVFDTFSFEFNVPTNFDMGKEVEFAVCYEFESTQLWDNSNGENYHIVSADFKKKEVPSYVPSNWADSHPNWTQYATWNHVDTSTPYW